MIYVVLKVKNMKKITFEEVLDGGYDYDVAIDLVSDAMYMEEASMDYRNLVEELFHKTFLLKRYFNPEVISYVEEYHCLMITQGNVIDVYDAIKTVRAFKDSSTLEFLEELLDNYVPLRLIDDYTVKVKPTILSHASSAEANCINPFRNGMFGDYGIETLAEAVSSKPCSNYYEEGAYLWIQACCDFLNSGNEKFYPYILGGNVKLVDLAIFCDHRLTLWSKTSPSNPIDEDSANLLRSIFSSALKNIHELLYLLVEEFFKHLNNELNSILDRIDDYKKIFIYNDLYIETRKPMFLVDDNDKLTHIVDEDGNSLGIGFVDAHF